MAASKYLQIDGTEYRVSIVDMQRKGDILDLEATRKEDGSLYRDVIGTYYNYTITIGVINDEALYESLWWKLTEPVASHQVQLPYQPEPFTGYFGSCKDTIVYIQETDPSNQSYGAKVRARGLSFNLVASLPSRVAGAT